jgi:ribosome-associated protein
VPASEEAVALGVAAAAAADERSATDMILLEVADVLVVADLFLVVSVSNERQLGAVAQAIEAALNTHERKVLRREGTPSSGWLLLDFGDLVCHVLHAEQREFYALERLWADVPHRDPATGAVLDRA